VSGRSHAVRGKFGWGPEDGRSGNDEGPWRDARGLVINGRNERIRTSDPLLPKQVRYQAALHSEAFPGSMFLTFSPLFVNEKN
jgi:hypothetical protein